jgi:hypothetical protein
MSVQVYSQAEYYKLVRGIEPADLIRYYPCWEQLGDTAIRDLSKYAENGSNSGATLGASQAANGDRCPSFPGTTTEFINISNNVNADMSKIYGTIMAHVKVSAVGDWTDGQNRYAVAFDAGTEIVLAKDNGNNTLRFQIGSDKVEDGGHSETGWLTLTGTLDDVANVIEFFVNGVSVGTDTCPVLGVYNNVWIGKWTGGGWKGYIAHVAIWKKVLSDTQIALLHAQIR